MAGWLSGQCEARPMFKSSGTVFAGRTALPNAFVVESAGIGDRPASPARTGPERAPRARSVVAARLNQRPDTRTHEPFAFVEQPRDAGIRQMIDVLTPSRLQADQTAPEKALEVVGRVRGTQVAFSGEVAGRSRTCPQAHQDGEPCRIAQAAEELRPRIEAVRLSLASARAHANHVISLTAEMTSD